MGFEVEFNIHVYNLLYMLHEKLGCSLARLLAHSCSIRMYCSYEFYSTTNTFFVNSSTSMYCKFIKETE